jgi:hypothetical protein
MLPIVDGVRVVVVVVGDVMGGGGWWVRLCLLRAWSVVKNWFGAVGQLVKQHEKIPVFAQIEWLVRWKVAWWFVWQRCHIRVDVETKCRQVPDCEWGQPVIGQGNVCCVQFILVVGGLGWSCGGW